MKTCELFVDRGDTILCSVNGKPGKEISIDKAKRLWAAGKVTNANLAMTRLATKANWDFVELRRQYAEMDKARGK